MANEETEISVGKPLVWLAKAIVIYGDVRTPVEKRTNRPRHCHGQHPQWHGRGASIRLSAQHRCLLLPSY